MKGEIKLKTVGDLKKALSNIPEHIPIESHSSTSKWDGCDEGFIYVLNETLIFTGIDDGASYPDAENEIYLEDLI